jgi:hypothetical protein
MAVNCSSYFRRRQLTAIYPAQVSVSIGTRKGAVILVQSRADEMTSKDSASRRSAPFLARDIISTIMNNIFQYASYLRWKSSTSFLCM